MIQRVRYDHRAYTRVRMYMYTQAASDSRFFPEKGGRVTSSPPQRCRGKGKKEEEEMICTGRAAYTETKALHMCVCVSLSVKPRANCVTSNRKKFM